MCEGPVYGVVLDAQLDAENAARRHLQSLRQLCSQSPAPPVALFPAVALASPTLAPASIWKFVPRGDGPSRPPYLCAALKTCHGFSQPIASANRRVGPSRPIVSRY